MDHNDMAAKRTSVSSDFGELSRAVEPHKKPGAASRNQKELNRGFRGFSILHQSPTEKNFHRSKRRQRREILPSFPSFPSVQKEIRAIRAIRGKNLRETERLWQITVQKALCLCAFCAARLSSPKSFSRLFSPPNLSPMHRTTQ
jgi:hypothetical protein